MIEHTYSNKYAKIELGRIIYLPRLNVKHRINIA